MDNKHILTTLIGVTGILIASAALAISANDRTTPPGATFDSRHDEGQDPVARANAPAANRVSEPDTDSAEGESTSDIRNVESARQSALKGILGGVHDFSNVSGSPSDACSACHVPHLQARRPARAGEESSNLTYYRIGGQRSVLVPDRYMPGPTSLICLSCHNGTVASSTVGSSHALLAGLREGFSSDGAALRDHPIGIPYPSRADGYRSLNEVTARGDIPLPEGRIECVSCHDPHGAPGVDHLLVMSNRRSALCLACHIK